MALDANDVNLLNNKQCPINKKVALGTELLEMQTNLTVAEVTVTAAELAALATTPKTLVAAPGAGKVLEFVSAVIFLDYSAPAITENGALAVRYTDGSGTIVSATIAGAAFVELTADAYADTQALSASTILTANKALVLDATEGNPTVSGTLVSTLTVRVTYRTHDFT